MVRRTGIGPFLAILFECLSMCSVFFEEMCVSVPHGTYFEQGATAQVLSLHNCGFRSEYPSAVNETFVAPSFPRARSLITGHRTFCIFYCEPSVLGFVCAYVDPYFLSWVHCAWYQHVGTTIVSQVKDVHFLHLSDYSVWFDACLEHISSAVC